jgi:hypothetical protein
MIAKTYPTQQEINKFFIYKDGILYWKSNHGKKIKANAKAGWHEKDSNYNKVKVLNKTYLEHRLVYILFKGHVDNIIQIDHKDNNRQNNNIENLRASTNTQNHCNSKKYKRNTSGFKGVSYHQPNNKWRAKINIDGKQTHLGLFKTPKQAFEAYKQAANKYHKSFACF